jgi:hypothetical protein
MAEVCPDCGASFAGPTDLAEHVQKNHHGGNATESMAMNPATSAPGFACGICGRSFDTPQELAAHDLTPHTAPRKRSRAVPG